MNAGAEAERGVPGLRLERERCRVAGLHLDQPFEAGLGDPRAALVGERLEPLDAHDAAAVGRGEHDSRPALAAGDVQDAALWSQPGVVAEQPDLLGARRVLEHVVALDDLPRPRHVDERTRHPSADELPRVAVHSFRDLRAEGGRESGCRRPDPEDPAPLQTRQEEAAAELRPLLHRTSGCGPPKREMVPTSGRPLGSVIPRLREPWRRIPCCGPERCPSGRRSATGNRVWAERSIAGSNPALSVFRHGDRAKPGHRLNTPKAVHCYPRSLVRTWTPGVLRVPQPFAQRGEHEPQDNGRVARMRPGCQRNPGSRNGSIVRLRVLRRRDGPRS